MAQLSALAAVSRQEEGVQTGHVITKNLESMVTSVWFGPETEFSVASLTSTTKSGVLLTTEAGDRSV
ncbi:hypothetical protein TsFJ059_002178 [Trichoderma semiorbis]|uniref:Uncharacterized protein n=1 Tax=Trichoderma semiorbis TaxID=1491008 RepID=A0A9P8KN26_9HYPO|nr:hypothetical protein TsFJ059_002178 [Trichoderma semiorbis]